MAELETKATIKTLGDAFVITAGFKLDTIKDLTKYGMGQALKLIDEKTEEEYFRVSTGEMAEVSRFGVVFTSKDPNGYAQCTGSFPELAMSDADKRNYLKDNFAFVITNLNKVQEHVVAAEKALDKVMADVDTAIVTM